ncbi:MAG TPA: TraM recognition domain-containing protein [Ktedonobacterales bacterium]
MFFGDLLSDLQAWNDRLMVFVLALVGIGFITMLARILIQRRRGGPGSRKLRDRFKTRQRRRSRKALQELARGASVVLGKNLQAWPRQDIILPERSRCLNVINLGPVGAGKTSYFLSTFIAADIARPDVALVLFDGQREMTEQVLALAQRHHREVVLYPDAGFNPLVGPGGPHAHAALFADLFAQVSETGTQGASGYYLQKAQSFLRKTIPLYERAYRQPMLLQELLELCLSDERREGLLAAAAGSPEAREYTLFCNNWSKSDFDQNLSGLVNFLDRLCVGRNAFLYNQRHAPTLAECLEQKKVVMIRAGGPVGTQEHTLGLLYMISLQAYAAQRAITHSPHLVSVFLDEAHLYFTANFPTFIATARKRRVALQLGFQAFEQLEPFRQTITTNARTWIVHNGLLHLDAQVVADNIGKRNFQTRSWSYARFREPHATVSDTWDYLVQPHEIRGLDANHVLILTVEGRETAAHVLARKPRLLDLPTTPYHEPAVPMYAPPTIWAEPENRQPSTTSATRQAASDW